MPIRMINCKKYVKSLSFNEEMSEITFSIDGIHNLNNMVNVKENINKKYRAINELKTLKRQIISNNKEIYIIMHIICFN